jgi:hypothetical protein
MIWEFANHFATYGVEISMGGDPPWAGSVRSSKRELFRRRIHAVNLGEPQEMMQLDYRVSSPSPHQRCKGFTVLHQHAAVPMSTSSVLDTLRG